MSELELQGEIDEALRRGVAVVWSSNAESSPLGTAFFIGNDGSLLTCLHVLKPKEGSTVEEVLKAKYLVQFGNEDYPAECIFVPSEPCSLDIAILRLEIGRVPNGGELLPLGRWKESIGVGGDEYVSLGYRSPGGLLRSKGEIEGRVEDGGLPYLQLSSEARGEQGARQGMSGAPVLHNSSRKVVGIIARRYQTLRHDDGDERVPFAVPIDAVAKIWQPLRERLRLTELYDKLTWILSPDGYFAPLLFRELLAELPGNFYFPSDNNDKTFTPKALLEHLARHKQLNTFVPWLLQSRFSNAGLKLRLNIAPFYDEFANRKSELRALQGASLYMLVEAPPGYGKTSLLKKLETSLMSEQWVSYYLEVPDSSPNCTGIAVALQEKFGRAGVAASNTVQEMGRQLGQDLLELKSSLYSGRADVPSEMTEDRGVILLIDNLERIPDDEELKKLFHDFLPAIHSVLFKQLPFRVRVAGRRGTAERLQERPPLVEVLPLGAFDYDNVVQTVSKKFPEASDAHDPETPLRAAHLWNLTGGHPGSMAGILQQPDIASPPDYIFLRNQEKRLGYEKIVLKATDEVRESIPEDLQAVFDSLSFFRKFTFRIIDQAIEHGLLDWSREHVKRLADRLTQTYLIRRKAGFYEDEIVRRLLVIRMRLNQPKEFLRGYEIARKIYHENLVTGYYHPAQVVLEAIFVELQLRYYRLDPQTGRLKAQDDLNERKHLYDEFFAENGLLNHYLSQLQDRDDYLDLVDSLKAEAISDKEFAFTLNYFLRSENYGNAPFLQFQSIIESKSRELTERSGG